jgi:hypothetical protein
MQGTLDAPVASRQPLLTLLQDLQQALEDSFETWRPGSRAGPQRLQLGVELLCKLEEQLLHPALKRSRGTAWPALTQAMGDVERLRELSSRIDGAEASHRALLVGTLEGMARLHFETLQALLRDADAAAVPWAALAHEMQSLLRRWRAEILQRGEIEDEDGDPVGQPPR